MAASSGGAFATLTHARLRVAQGDAVGAARILRVILAVQPGHREARALLDELESRPAVSPDGAPSTRIRRLSSWLLLLQKNRGARHAR